LLVIFAGLCCTLADERNEVRANVRQGLFEFGFCNFSLDSRLQIGLALGLLALDLGDCVANLLRFDLGIRLNRSQFDLAKLAFFRDLGIENRLGSPRAFLGQSALALLGVVRRGRQQLGLVSLGDSLFNRFFGGRNRGSFFQDCCDQELLLLEGRGRFRNRADEFGKQRLVTGVESNGRLVIGKRLI
jgi:hypothetical protein